MSEHACTDACTPWTCEVAHTAHFEAHPIIPGPGLSHHPSSGYPIRGASRDNTDPRDVDHPSDADADNAAGWHYPQA